MAAPSSASNLKEPQVMPRNLLRYRTLLVVVLALACRLTLADDGKVDKDKPVPPGIWEKKDAEPKLEFAGDDKLTIFPHGGTVAIQIDCSYTVTKDGFVKAKITRLGGPDDVIEKVKGSAPVGLEFRFKWKIDGDKATLDDLNGEDVEQIKNHLQGEYTKKS
jgi:hypothetical protein